MEGIPEAFGKDGSRALVVKAASEIMNPGLDRAFIDAQYEDDPISAAAEYGAEFRSDVAEFVRMEVLELARPTACLNCRRYPA